MRRDQNYMEIEGLKNQLKIREKEREIVSIG